MMINKATYKRVNHYMKTTVSYDEQPTKCLLSEIADCFMENENCRMY